MKKTVIVVIVEAVLLAVIALAVMDAYQYAFADEDGYYVICDPGSYVNARNSPKKTSEVVGRLECGDYVRTDGKTRNGYVHIIDCSFEQPEAWVSVHYVVTDQPHIGEWHTVVMGEGRVAARRNVDGKRLRWLKPGTGITIYVLSKEWCITNRGFVRSAFLGVN